MPDTTTEERREKREARRQKQREQNVLRAGKMHAARIAENPKSRIAKADRVSTEKQKIHIGCSGWFYWHWRDVFYPASVSTSNWFTYYADRFKTVELNAPFYSWPTLRP